MRIWVLTLAALSLSVAAYGQQGWADKMFKDGDRLILSHDFGTVARGTQLKHTFNVTNIYAVRMEITSIKSGCGCVTATIGKRVLEPRESTTLEVSMDARRFAGPKTVTVRVTVGPEYISTAEVKVTANSRADVVFNPGEINFGNVAQGQTPTQVIDVEYAGVLDWHITEVVTNGVPYTATLKESYRKLGQPGQVGQVGYKLVVTLKPDAPAGVLKHDIYLKTNDKASPLVPVLVEANVLSSLTVSPSVLPLGTVTVGMVNTRRVVVRGNKPFRILSIEGVGDGIELGAPVSGNDSDTHFITLKCAFERNPGFGPFRREIKVKTSAQDVPVIVVVEGSMTR